MRKRILQAWGYIRTALDIASMWQLLGLTAATSFLIAWVRATVSWWSQQDLATQWLIGVGAWLSIFVILGKLWSLIRPRSSVEQQESKTLVEVKRRTFEQGETVLIDGHSFEECTFKDCTLLYNGGPFQVGNNKLERTKGKMYLVASTNLTVTRTLMLLRCFKLMEMSGFTVIPKDQTGDG